MKKRTVQRWISKVSGKSSSIADKRVIKQEELTKKEIAKIVDERKRFIAALKDWKQGDEYMDTIMLAIELNQLIEACLVRTGVPLDPRISYPSVNMAKKQYYERAEAARKKGISPKRVILYPSVEVEL